MTSRVRIRRTGGFLGQTLVGRFDLMPGDPRSEEVESLLASVDLARVPTGPSLPDMYSYEFSVDDVVRTVPEHLLPAPLRRLAALVLPASGM